MAHPHVIEVTEATCPRGGSRTAYVCGPCVVRGRTDALRDMLRLMVAHGLSGPAHTVGRNGVVRLRIKDIGKSATRSLTERSATGFRLVRYVPDAVAYEEAA